MKPFTYESSKENGVIKLILTGKVGENIELPNLIWKPIHDEVNKIVIDFENVTAVNSTGIRLWLVWIKTLPKDTKILFRYVPRFFIDQINMIIGVVPAQGVVESFYVPYYCEDCDDITHELFSSGDLEHNTQCPKCNQDAVLDIISDKYLKFLD